MAGAAGGHAGGVAHVAEQGLVAGALVVEDEFGRPGGEIRRQLRHVLRRLLGRAAQRRAGGLGLDDTAGLAVDEEQVVAGSRRELELAHSDAERGIAVDLRPVLQHPARRHQQPVDPRPRQFLRPRRLPDIAPSFGECSTCNAAANLNSVEYA